MSQSVITAPAEPAETWIPVWAEPEPAQTEIDGEDDAEPNFRASCRIAARFLM